MARIPTCLLALIAALALLMATTAPASSAGSPAAEIAKGKCKKGKAKGKKAKCKKKKKPKIGPQIPAGNYGCWDPWGYPYGYRGTMHFFGGGLYSKDSSAKGKYTYNPSNGTMAFLTGVSRDYYAIFDKAAVEFDVHVAWTDQYSQYGDYAWTCSRE